MRRICRAFVLIVLIVLTVPTVRPSHAQLPRSAPELVGMSSARLARIRAALQASVSTDENAGIVTMLARDGKLVAVDSAGFADREGKLVMRSNTLFRLASMTKAVTSVSAMILVEEGKLLLNDPVSRYLPAFRQMRVAIVAGPDSARTVTYERARRQITIRDLLTHRAGLTYGFGDAGPVGEMYRAAGVTDGIALPAIPTQAENVDRLAQQPLMHQPGATWTYGLNTDVLGRVVEVVSGQTLAEFMRERIFRPLRMTQTGFVLSEADAGKLAVPYSPDSTSHLVSMNDAVHKFSDGRLLLGGKAYRGSATFFSGGGGLVGTAGDYLRFLQMLANGGELEGVRMLGRKTVELMTSSHTGDLTNAPLGQGSGFGLGFQVLEDPGKAGVFGSAGTFSWGGIYGTQFWVDPKERLVGVLMIQRFPTTGSRISSVFRTLAYQAIVR